jgi:hypothetical protein
MEGQETKPGPTGTYVYDKRRGEIVRISAEIPKVASKGGKDAAPEACGGGVRGETGGCADMSGGCGGGMCGME